MSIIKQVCVFLIVCAVFTNVSSAPRVTRTVTSTGDEDTAIQTTTLTKTKNNGDVVSRTTSTLVEQGDDLQSKKDDLVIRTVSKNVVSTTDSGDIITTDASRTMAKSGAEADNKLIGVSADSIIAVTGDGEATATAAANMKTTGNGAAMVKGRSTSETIVNPGTGSTAVVTGGIIPVISSSGP